MRGLEHRLGRVAVVLAVAAAGAPARGEDAAPWLRDRGPGIPTSLFGSYMEPGDLLVYPFYEYYNDHDAEYAPDELGFKDPKDYRGKYVAHEALIFLGYAFNDWVAAELEAAVISASQEKSSEDPSGLEDKVTESGVGDVEGQFRWRYNKETARLPEFYNYFEWVMPTQPEGKLIGTSDWELKLGVGMIKGFRFGTMTFRAAWEYDAAEQKTDVGEFALEYLKRLNEKHRVIVAVEGAQDETEGIVGWEYWFTPDVSFKINNGFGLTSKATDIAPEVGLMLRF